LPARGSAGDGLGERREREKIVRTKCQQFVEEAVDGSTGRSRSAWSASR